MGIHDLLPFLRKTVPDAFEVWTPALLKGRRIAVDVPIWAHKLAAIEGHADHVVEGLQRGLLNFLHKEGPSQIVCVFDGQKTPLKDRERGRRQTQRNLQESKKLAQNVIVNSTEGPNDRPFDEIMLVTRVDTETCLSDKPSVSTEIPVIEHESLWPKKKHYLALMEWTRTQDRITSTVAIFEAEAKCAQLCAANECDQVLTEDSDALAFGATRVILHYGKEKCEIVTLDKILTGLKMTLKEFQDFCVLCGCDFLERLPLMGPSRLYSFFQKKLPSEDLRMVVQTKVANHAWTVEHANEWPQVIEFFRTRGSECMPMD